MNAVFAAVLLAVVATCSATSVVSWNGANQVYYPTVGGYSGYQYVQPSVGYNYVQPVVSSSSVASHVPVAYTGYSSYVPTVNSYGYTYGYPYGYSYGYVKK